MTLTQKQLEELRERVAELAKTGIADSQTLAILQANITLALDQMSSHEKNVISIMARSKEAIAEARAAVTRLGDLDRAGKQSIAEGKAMGIKVGQMEKTAADTVHRQASLRAALTATLDYLDRLEASTVVGEKGGSA